MLHEPIIEIGEDNAAKKKSKLGLILVSVYGFFYFAFVFVGVFFTDLLGTQLFGGLSLAVVYGFGIIFLAIVMGFVYSLVCTRMEDNMNGGGKK